MDFSNYWQENKRFLTAVGVGAALFFAAWTAIDHYLGAELRAQQQKKLRIEGDLKQALYTAVELERAQGEFATLSGACATLRKACEFAARPEFRMEKGVPATSRYFNLVERTRDELKRRAGRAGMALPSDLGMPAVAPTKEVELARYLEALDAVEQTVQCALLAGCERIDAIRVKLDSNLLSGKPNEGIERTTVEFKLVGSSLPMARLLTLLQEPRNGRVLQLVKVDVEPARAKNADDVKLEFVLLLAHLNRIGQPAGAEEPQ